MANLTLRLVKGSMLTMREMDDNLIYLNEKTVDWDSITGSQSVIKLSNFDNDLIMPTWNTLGGTRSGITLSGFDDDLNYLKQADLDSQKEDGYFRLGSYTLSEEFLSTPRFNITPIEGGSFSEPISNLEISAEHPGIYTFSGNSSSRATGAVYHSNKSIRLKDGWATNYILSKSNERVYVYMGFSDVLITTKSTVPDQAVYFFIESDEVTFIYKNGLTIYEEPMGKVSVTDFQHYEIEFKDNLVNASVFNLAGVVLSTVSLRYTPTDHNMYSFASCFTDDATNGFVYQGLIDYASITFPNLLRGKV